MAKKVKRVRLPSFDQWMERLNEAGFAVHAAEGGGARISKHGCAAVLQPSASGEPHFAVRPGLLVGAGSTGDRASVPAADEAIAHLVDRGFQKFWQAGERQFPALAAQLQALHRFDQDLRAEMGLTSLYNESLGTVSSRYVYDRVEGREKPRRGGAF